MIKNRNSTIKDIGDALEISIATVSRALNNSPNVNPLTKKKVLDIATRLNYKPNQVALALKSGETKFAGVIVPFLNHDFFSSVIGGIESVLSPEGYHVAIYQTHEKFENELKYVRALLLAQVDGIFLSTTRETKDDYHITEILQQKKPLIFFDRKLNVPGTSSVTINDYKAAYEATKHLIDQSAKRIIHFAGDLRLEIYKDRYNGYLKALADHDIEFDKRLVYQTNQESQAGYNGIKKILNLNLKPDAIFSSNDVAVTGALRYLRENNFKIPQDILIASYSNEPFTQFMETPISSVDQRPILMGQKAAEIFLNKVQNKELLEKENNIILEPEFLIRKSSLKPS